MRALAPLALALASLACTSAPSPAPENASQPIAAQPAEAAPAAEPSSPPSPSCARAAAAPAASPLDPTGAGSGVALARLGDRVVAFVADEDDAAIHTVDLDARAAIARTPLAGKPAQVLVLSDGRVVASLRDRGALEVLEPGAPSAPLSRRCLVPVATEPVGLALARGGELLLAASRWGHALTAFSARDLAPLGAIDLPRDPAAVVASEDGRLAFVSHAAGGRVSVVELGEVGAPVKARELAVGAVEWREPRFSLKEAPFPFEDGARRKRPSTRVEQHGSQGFALARGPSGAVFAPIALVDPGSSATGAGGYGSAGASTVIGQVAVIDPKSERVQAHGMELSLGIGGCRLPRAAAIDPTDELLLVTCLGHDTLITYDARAEVPNGRELARVRAGAGPTGLAVDAAGRRAVIFAQYDGAVTIAPIGRDRSGPTQKAAPPDAQAIPADVAVIPLPRARAADATVARGRALFHAAGGRRIAFDGRACASCHPDGRDDGLTWATPEGPRQTPVLLGRLDGTAPYGWEGDKKDLPGHFARTMSRLSGTGLSADERDALFAYVRSLEPPRGADALAPEDRAALIAAPAPRPAAEALIARGQAVFHEEQAGCSSCHLGDEVLTDGARHDVKSAARFDAARRFETPSLRFVARSAPYYHDGRYPTLRALIDGVDGAMGHTAHLAERDREALVAYLESL